MISRKAKILEHPWQKQRYDQHRGKVNTATARVDHSQPPQYYHIRIKSKKMQTEMERISLIYKENVRLLQNLGNIMQTKRMTDFWKEPRPNFLGREKLFETATSSSSSASKAKPHSKAQDKNANEGKSFKCLKCEKRHNKGK